jgi:hypothetical protein
MTVIYAVDLQEITGVNNSIEDLSDATLLLGLDELAVERVVLGADGVRVVHVVTAGLLARGWAVSDVVSTRYQPVFNQPSGVVPAR